MRRAAKQDANAAELVEYARDRGMLVEYIGEPTDLLVFWKVWHVVEVKTEDGDYTPEQRKFIKKTGRYGAPIRTWVSKEDIDRLILQ